MRRVLPVAAIAAVTAALLATATVVAQIEGGDRGVAAVDSSNDFEVSGIQVDVTGPNAEATRLAGWREAQRKAWAQLSQRMGGGGAMVPDGTLDSIVSSIVVDNEQIGPNRYIARLGVLFDRDRTAALLGVSSVIARSPPLVVIPVQWSTGVGTVFEQRTLWQEAWARYRTGGSEIDYIRPVGNGPDALLLDVGQTQRPARGWWRSVLDQYGGTDVLMPVARLYRQWPGGPVIGAFEARYGPDNRLLSYFTLRVGSPSGIPALLDAAVKRMDAVYQDALRGGYLRADPGLVGEQLPAPEASPTPGADDLSPGDLSTAAPATAITVQFDTPDAGTVSATEGALRGIPGVVSASTSSLALGGVSLMSVTFAGTPDAFRAVLQARGWLVFGGEHDPYPPRAAADAAFAIGQRYDGMSQFALPLAWAADARDAEFMVTASNERAVRMLDHWATWPVRTAILAGPPRSGRSTLGRIFAARSGADVIDDADHVAEEMLFHAWNRAQDARRPLLLIAAALPPAWQVTLPDLRSRLAASPSAQLGAPDDLLVRALFEHGFARRHLDARADLIAWLVARVERSHAAVMETIDTLDRAALAGRRRLSIPLARETLAHSATFNDRSEPQP